MQVRALPTADRFLVGFFADRRRGAHGARLDRIDRVEADLRLAIELTGEEALGADDLMLLAAERQLAPIAPVARVLPLTGLPAVLHHYLTDPLYVPRPVDEARARLDTCAALVRRMARDADLLGETRRLRRLDERIHMELAIIAPARGPIRMRHVRK